MPTLQCAPRADIGLSTVRVGIFFCVLLVAAALMSGGSASATDITPKPQIVTNTAFDDGSISVFSDDGRYVLFGNGRSMVRLWEAATGNLVRSYIAKSSDAREYVQGIGFSAALDVVVSNNRYGVISIWKASTGQLLRTLDRTLNRSDDDWNPQDPFVFTLDGKRMLSADRSGGAVHLWDTATWKVVRTIEVRPKGQITFSPDRKFALVDDRRVVADKEATQGLSLIDLTTGKQVWSLVRGDEIGAAVFSPDGSRIATGLAGPNLGTRNDQDVKNRDGAIKIIDARTGEGLRTVSFRSQWADVKSLAFSPDGARLFSASADGTIRVWDVRNGLQVGQTANVSGADAGSLVFSPDGTRILLSDGDTRYKISDPQSGTVIATFGQEFGPAAFLTSRPGDKSGASLVSANFLSGSTILHRWDFATGRLVANTLLKDFDSPAMSIAADGSYAVSSNDEPEPGKTTTKPAVLWDPATGKPIGSLPDGAKYVQTTISPDSKLIAYGTGNTVTLWNRASGNVLWTVQLVNHDAARGQNDEKLSLNALAFSLKGDLIAVGCSDGTHVLDATNGRLVRYFEQIAQYGVSSVAFAPDGQRIVTGTGNWSDNVSIWDISSGKELHQLSGHAKGISGVAFSPDGLLVLSGGYDGTARMWNATTGKPLHVLRLDSGSSVNAVVFAANGTRAVTGHADGSVAVWDSKSGALLLTLVAGADGEWVAITPEGFFDASAKGSALLHVVNGLETVTIDQVFQNLFRPDLVREKLAGDPQGKVRAAAAELDLDKVLASGAAPLMRIVTPLEGIPAAQEQITVKVELTPRAGGVGRIEWRVNGQTHGVNRGLQGATDKPITVEHAIELDPGSTTIEVVAYNAKGLLASAPARVRVRWDGTTGAAPPRLFVLAVGINDYFDSRLRLNYAASDAQSFADALKLAGRNLFEVVNVSTVLNQEATRDHIGADIDKIARGMKPSDVFVFFLVGHGATLDGRYYFLPSDFRYGGDDSIRNSAITQDQLQSWFAEVPAKKTVLIFDTCESGSMTQEVIATRGLEHLVAVERLTRAMGRTVLSASTADAPALEGYHNHGVYTYALLEALDKADSNGDGLITVTELAEYLAARVPDLSYDAFKFRQIPQMKIVGSTFPIAQPTDVLGKEAVTNVAAPSMIPTHVVTRSVDVLVTPSVGAPARTLAPGTIVSIILTAHGWSLIAKDGLQLGYVPDDSLARLQ
jgi:WD40 repeat protein